MGARGPARTPTPILKARGSWLADTAERKNEPQLTVGSPAKPKFLSPIASAEWEAIVSELVPSGVLTKADGPALAALSESYAEMVAACEGLAAIKTKRIRWAVGRKRAAISEFLKAAAQFGMTPAARSRVQAIKEADGGSDKKAKYFGKAS